MSQNMDYDHLELFLDFIHKEFLNRPNDFISLEEIVGSTHLMSDEILRAGNYCVLKEWVEYGNRGVTLAAVRINEKGIKQLSYMKSWRSKFLHRKITISGRSIPIWSIVFGIITVIIIPTGFLWFPLLQCQFQVGIQDETYVNCPIGFYITRPSPDWSFNDVRNQVILPDGSDFLGGITVQSPIYDNVRVLVFNDNLVTIDQFRQNELQLIKSKYNITSFWTLPTPNEPDLIQLIAKNKNSTLFLKEKVESQKGKIFVIQMNAQAYFLSSIPDDDMKTLDQIYRSFGYTPLPNKS